MVFLYSGFVLSLLLPALTYSASCALWRETTTTILLMTQHLFKPSLSAIVSSSSTSFSFNKISNTFLQHFFNTSTPPWFRVLFFLLHCLLQILIYELQLAILLLELEVMLVFQSGKSWGKKEIFLLHVFSSFLWIWWSGMNWLKCWGFNIFFFFLFNFSFALHSSTLEVFSQLKINLKFFIYSFFFIHVRNLWN